MKDNNITYDSFELLYLYVENIRCFESHELKFTAEYNIKYSKSKRKLTIEETHENDHLKGFFGPNISNINVIVGKNGSGKTTILNILGYYDDIRESISKNENSAYFCIFKTNNNDIYIEGYNDCIKKINSNINNIQIQFNEKCEKYFNFSIDLNDIKNINFEHINFDNDNKKNTFITLNKYFRTENDVASRIMPMIDRKYTVSSKKTFNSSLYELLTCHSEYKFIDLLKLTNIDLVFNIELDTFEEKVIYSYLSNIINKPSNKKNNLLAFVSASFIWKTTKSFSKISKDLTKFISDAQYSLYQINKDNLKYYHPLNKISRTLYTIQNKLTKSPNNDFVNTVNDMMSLLDDIFEYINEIDDKIKDSTSFLSMSTDVHKAKETIDILYNFFTNQEIITLLEHNDIILNLPFIVKTFLKNHQNHTFFEISFESYKNLINTISKLYDSTIQNIYDTTTKKIIINCNAIYNQNIYDFLKCLDDINSINSTYINRETKSTMFVIEYGHNISSGEFQLLSEILNIYNTIKEHKTNQLIILLDEPDIYLHPDWSTKFINCLINMVDDISKEIKKETRIKYQFFITTHSPFMLSDIPKEYIHTINIDIDKKTGNHIRKVEKAKNSFASNYYDLLNNSFFLDSTLGHYARKKIEEILEIINKTMTSNQKKPKNNKTFINILSAYDYDFLDIIKITKINNPSDISDTIVQKYNNLFSNKKINDILTIVKNNKEKSTREILNILKRDNIYLSIDHDYIYKKLYKMIEIIDEPFIRESLKQELDKKYKNINATDFIDSKITILEQELYNLKKLKNEK